MWGLSRDSGDGVVATAPTNGTGLFAAGGFAIRANGQILSSNTSGVGADITGSNVGLIGRASGVPLLLTDNRNNVIFWVDSAGNVNHAGFSNQFARIAGGALIRSFSPKTTLPTVEDTGTAQLANGAAVVRLDATFIASIEPSARIACSSHPTGTRTDCSWRKRQRTASSCAKHKAVARP